MPTFYFADWAGKLKCPKDFISTTVEEKMGVKIHINILNVKPFFVCVFPHIVHVFCQQCASPTYSSVLLSPCFHSSELLMEAEAAARAWQWK